MSDGMRFTLPVSMSFDEIELLISRTFGTMVKRYFPAPEDTSFCLLKFVAGGEVHDLTLSLNGEPDTPFYGVVSASLWDKPKATMDQFREIAHSHGGSVYIGGKVVLPYTKPDAAGQTLLLELVDIVGRNAALVLAYRAKDATKRDRIITLLQALGGHESSSSTADD